jgi:hypothetical protein
MLYICEYRDNCSQDLQPCSHSIPHELHTGLDCTTSPCNSNYKKAYCIPYVEENTNISKCIVLEV